MSITFVDNVTPLDAVHMNALVQKDNVVVAATRIFASKLAAGDAQPAFKVNGDGGIHWGPGGSAAADTNLYRLAAATLKTDTSFYAGGDIAANLGGVANQVWLHPSGHIVFGTAQDTNLYRSEAGVLFTDGYFTAATGLFGAAALGEAAVGAFVVGETQDRWEAWGDGSLHWGPGGTTPLDTSLYRSAAGILATGGEFQVASRLTARAAGQAQVVIGDKQGDGVTPTVAFGNPVDTFISRIGAGALGFTGGIYIQSAPFGIGLSYNPATFNANNIAFQSTVTGENPRFVIQHGGDLHWGPGGSTASDTSLYRSAVGPFLEGSGFLTSAGVANVFVGCGPTPAYFPSPLTVGSLWYDTASTPQMLKLEALSQGVAWRDVGIAIGGGRLLTNTIVFGAGGSNFDTSLSRSAAGVLAVNGVPIGGGGAVMTGDYKVSAITATHADPNGGSWLLCDGAPIPGGYAALIALVGGYTPDARGRVLTTVGANAAVNAVGKSDGVALANRRPQHQHTPHTHAASLSNGPVSHNSGSAAGTTTNDDSQYQSGNQIGVTVTAAGGGSGVATDSLDAPAFCVVGSLFIHT